MKLILEKLKIGLEKLDHYRDEALFIFIKPHWPKFISPNTITYARFLAGMLLFVLLFFFNIDHKALIISIFCVGALTDLLDGSVARGLNKVTEFGAMLDPIADRILIIPIAVYSLYYYQKWLLFLLLAVEVINAIIAIFYKSNEPYSSNIFGKTRMVLISIVFGAILIFWPNAPSLFFVDLLWISLVFSFLSIFTRILELYNQGFIKNRILSNQLDKYINK